MITAREVTAALYGSWRLARLDPGGMAYFNRTVEGFWNSFFAAVIVAPGYIVLILLHLGAVGSAAIDLRTFLVETIAYIIGWLAFPLAMAYVAPLLGRGDRFIALIVAYNWAAVLQTAAFLLTSILAHGALLPKAAASLLSLGMIIAIYVYYWFVARTALKVSGGQAAAVVALDVALGLLVTGIGDGLIVAA